jgi:transcriptional regulator with XRE-family HTH domain
VLVGNDWERHFGARVKDLRNSRRWTQEELAKRMTAAGHAMHQTTIAKLEGGNRPTTIGEASVIAAIFNMPIARLFDTYDAEDYAELAILANRLAALSAEKVKLAERISALDADYALAEKQYHALQVRIEEDEEQARYELQDEENRQAFMDSGEPMYSEEEVAEMDYEEGLKDGTT